MSKQEKSVIFQTLGIFWQALVKRKFYAFGSLLMILVGIILNSYIAPFILAEIINKLQAGVDQSQLWQVFSPYIFAIAGLFLVSELILWRAGIWLLWKFEILVWQDLYSQAFNSLIYQSMSFHSSKMSGSLVSQSRSFAGSFALFYDTLIFNVFRILIGVVAILLVLTPVMPIYTAGLFVLAIIFTVIAALGLEGVSKANAKSVKSYSKLAGKFADAIVNIMAVKSSGREKHERKTLRAESTKAFNAEMELVNKITIRDFGFGSVLIAANLLVVVCAVYGQVWFGLSIGSLVLMMNYSHQLISQLWDINRIMRNFSKAFGDADAITRILSAENSVKDVEGAPDLEVDGGKISFNKIKFRHDGKKKALFKDFQLEIAPGERVGLVGQSGSGKTTLTKLLLRFADVAEGEILIDGQNIAKVSQRSLRSKVAYVPQETALFNRTIAENIAYGKPDATEEEIIQAAKLANAWNFIEELPKGLQTITGERGVQLSGGQRQRIAIARAILKNSPILILDEATSALDTESEKLIQEALDNLMKGRTSLVIAHRLSTVKNLDRIVVMDGGKIVESGTHEELLALDSTYAKLWNIQVGD